MNYSLKIALLLILCFTSGCASLMPYKDSYDCPQMEQGQCVSVSAAHEHALNAEPGSPGKKGAAVSPDPALAKAIENYRKAVVAGKPADIDTRQTELLRIINPGQAGEFSQALIEFRDAVKSGKNEKATEAESKLHGIHARAIAGARENVLLEHSMSSEATRHEFLGRYAQGQRAPAVMMPPVVMETYILPYQTEFGTLAGERTLWIMVEDPKWVWPDAQSSRQGADIGSTQRGR